MPANENPISILALNPSVDVSYEIDQLISNKKMRSTKTRYYPGGNGINVARALKELKLPISLYSIIGGESGNLLLRLLGDRLSDCHHCFNVEGETRLNAIIQQSNPHGQYEVDSNGPDIPEEITEQIIEAFLEVSHNNIAVLSGSIPPGVKETVYRDLTARLEQQACKVIVDAHGNELMNVMDARPYLLRLNRYVLESIVNRRLEQPEEVAEAAREIQQKGSNRVCVTLGQQGAILVDPSNSYYSIAPKMRIQSTVGCGDSVIAGMVAGISHGKRSAEILRFGVICGSTTASHNGTELFDYSEVMKEYDELEVIALNI